MIDVTNRNKMHDILRYYGTLLFDCYGEGKIAYEEGKQYECNFGIGQLFDGSIYFVTDADIIISGKLSYIFEELDKKFNFNGKTENGLTITFCTKGLVLVTGPIYLVYKISLFKIETNTNDPIKKINFGLTNFLFTGNCNDGKELSVNLPNLEPITIRQLPDYDMIVKQLNDKKFINVTSELVIPLKNDTEFEKAEEISRTICYLLSICRGSKIVWMYYTCFDEKGTVICQVRKDPTIFSLSSFPELIPPDMFWIDATKSFLEKSYQATIDYPKIEEYLGRLSDLYIDARIGSGYIDTQGLKSVVLMEVIVKYVLADPRFEIKEIILEDDEDLKMNIKNVIRSMIPDKNIRSALYENLTNINRTPFKKLITRLCEKIELKVDESDIESFVKSRNALIHTGFFSCEIDNPEERQTDQPSFDTFREYRFIINFIDKIFLKLFNYSGDYCNIQKWGITGYTCHKLKDTI